MRGMKNLAQKIRGISLAEVEAFVASRPLNSAMYTGKFSKLTGIRPRPWSEALRHFVIQGEAFRA
jgi:dTDP-4-dehydrorhamnose reductase